MRKYKATFTCYHIQHTVPSEITPDYSNKTNAHAQTHFQPTTANLS